MEPTVNQVHVDQPLTNFSLKFMQDQNDYVADKAFPIVHAPTDENEGAASSTQWPEETP